jgi:signal transduction histidine kinase/DNA-binding response OmpR family regulator/ligand-binding sensor domain-containing protein
MVWLCLAMVGVVSAQTNAGFETFTTSQGLSQGMVNDMIQDKEGFIWVATKGGLNRYDGYHFKVFTTEPQDPSSISSNAISNLLEDSKGRIWVGTYDGGINVYNKKSGRFLRIVQKQGDPTTLAGNRIESAMFEMPDGRILVCPQGAGLQLIALPDDWKQTPVISTVPVPAGRIVHGMSRDDKGFIWVGCHDQYIYIFNPVNGLELLSDAGIFTPLIAQVGSRLTARNGQTSLLKPDPTISLPILDAANRLLPGVLQESPSGKLFFNNNFPLEPGASGTLFYDFSACKPGDSISKVSSGTLTSLKKDQGFKKFLLDRSGTLWVGSKGYGIYKYPIRNQRFHPTLPGLSIQRITALTNDRLYVQGWGLTKMIIADGRSVANFLDPAIGNDPFNVMVEAKNGDCWFFLSGRKLMRYNAAFKLLGTWEAIVSTVSTEQIQPMIEDSRNNIWIAGENGTLAKIDSRSGEITKYVINTKELSGTAGVVQTNVFFEDAQGLFWLGTEHGFAKIDFNNSNAAPKITWYKNIPGNNQSLSYNYVSWFTNDPSDEKYLWVSTKGGGINRMEKATGKFTHYTIKQGLPNDIVYGLLSDNAGNLWGSTNKGIFCMLPGKNNEPPVFRLFSTSDGLQADEFNTNALAKLHNGNLVFGGVNGINIFDPQKVLAGSFSPNVYITSIQIGNKTIIPGDETGVLKETIEQSTSITLNYLQDVVTLEFSSLDFTAPGQNKYRYQMVGIDKEWVESGNRRTATYLHLPPGRYTFKVQGSNSQGIWSEHIAELTIKVLPPWWSSWWAYIIYALVIAFIIRAWLRFNVNKAKLQSQLNFEQLEAKRVKELDTIKTQLYTNITHEFRTPLTVILGMAQQVIDKPSEQFDSRMEMILRNGRSLFNLVNEMLDLSKLETGKMQLQLSHSDVIGFLRYIVESFHSLASSQQKQLHFLSDIDLLYLEYDREKIRQIVSNLLSNAIKFTPEKGNIYITVMENVLKNDGDNATLIIKVKDTGIGIPEDKLQHIFNRFYQLDNSHTRQSEGTGIGLALTKELVKLMEGEIIVKSPPTGATKGSEFTVLLPLKKVAPVPGDTQQDIYQQEPGPSPVPAVFSTADIDQEQQQAPLILLVEDNPDVVAYIASCLPDYRLAVGKDGREGFDIATQIIPDLIVTDVMMPFVDGFELVAQLRSNEYTSHIPVIMLTAKADIQSRIEGLQRGADVYLEKPFHKEELLVRIQKLLEMRKHLQQYYLKNAGIENGISSEAPLSQPTTLAETITAEKAEDAFVKKVREAVETNLTDVSFTVEKLCKLVFMSHSQLHRKLDALTGCSPNKFIRMIRLKKAKTLLADPGNSIASIALDCGYADPGYFARVFKQQYGVTPQEWRMKKDDEVK